MKVPYERLTDVDGVIDNIRRLSAKTVILDVEPLVAIWDTDQESLVRGVAGILDRVTAEAASVQVVVFATNSRRRLPATLERSVPHVIYLATAGKPLRTAPYRHLAQPGVVVGDQLATDGVLAWRLDFSFLHCRPHTLPVPLGPRIMHNLGRPLRPLLFTRTG